MGASTDYSLEVRELIDPSHPFAQMTHEQRLAEASGRGKSPKPGTPGYVDEVNRRGKDAELLIRAAVAAGADDTVMASMRQALVHMSPMGLQEIKKLPEGRQGEEAPFRQGERGRRPHGRRGRQLGNLLVSIGLAPTAKAGRCSTVTSRSSPSIRRARPSSKTDDLAYTATTARTPQLLVAVPRRPTRSDGVDGVAHHLARRISIAGSRMRPDMPSRCTPSAETWRNLSGRRPIRPLAAMYRVRRDAGVDSATQSSCRWFLDWLAHKLRKPHVRATAVVMVAVTQSQDQSFGSGRGTLFKILALLFGEEYVRRAAMPS